MTPWLIVGLGNPGSKYETTRHNLGFRVVDAMVADKTIPFSGWKKEADVTTAVLQLDDHKLFVIKPLTYMNESGTPVQRFVSFYKVAFERLLVIHDDLDLPFGELRPAFDRGPAGNNGVSDIMDKLGSKAFHRLRIGIGSNREQNLPAEDYVLQNFSVTEEAQLNGSDGIIAKAADWTSHWMRSSQS